MDLYYMIIGVFLFLTGLFIVSREYRCFLKELNESESTILVLVIGFLESVFLGGPGFVGTILILVGIAFFGSSIKAW